MNQSRTVRAPRQGLHSFHKNTGVLLWEAAATTAKAFLDESAILLHQPRLGSGACRRYTTLWYYHNVEFIESRPFTRKLHQLAGEGADELLKAIQGQLAQKPDRGALVPGLGGVRKARVANPGRAAMASAADTGIYICTWRKGATCSC